MYCLDTYALVEIHDGNQDFFKLIDKECVVTSLTLAEFYGLLYKRFNDQTAEYWKRKFLPITKEIGTDTLIEAMKFKIQNKVSFFDAVGYVYSQNKNMKFVTGDKYFKNKKGVMYISK